jgi:hypothetical protein
VYAKPSAVQTKDETFENQGAVSHAKEIRRNQKHQKRVSQVGSEIGRTDRVFRKGGFFLEFVQRILSEPSYLRLDLLYEGYRNAGARSLMWD